MYVNKFVINLDNLLDARYLILIAGMLLGNALRGNVVGIGDFYSDIKRNENRSYLRLSLEQVCMRLFFSHTCEKV